MIPEKKRLLREAMQLYEQLKRNSFPATVLNMPIITWQVCDATVQKIVRARQLGWLLAAARLSEELRDCLGGLRGDLLALEAVLPETDSSGFGSLGCIYADLAALHREFPAVNFDLRQRSLSVTTEPLELGEVYLGPFEIRLSWSQFGAGNHFTYQIIAEDPQPAASNESVTHPHVQREALCEGDGHHAIQRALEQHRLLDFFLLVDNILKTYNSSSPYVALEDWFGVDCADCGSTISSDGDRWICDKCGSGICESCYTICPDCDESFCSDCLTRCARCEEYHRTRCISECSACQVAICEECLNEQELCSDCQSEDDDEPTETASTEENGESCPSELTVQSHGLGKVTIPA